MNPTNVSDNIRDLLEHEHAKKRLEEELNDLRGVSLFIPNMQIYQKYISELLVETVLHLEKQKADNDNIIRMLKYGFHEVEKHEQEEKLAMSRNAIQKMFST